MLTEKPLAPGQGSTRLDRQAIQRNPSLIYHNLRATRNRDIIGDGQRDIECHRNEECSGCDGYRKRRTSGRTEIYERICQSRNGIDDIPRLYAIKSRNDVDRALAIEMRSSMRCSTMWRLAATRRRRWPFTGPSSSMASCASLRWTRLRPAVGPRPSRGPSRMIAGARCARGLRTSRRCYPWRSGTSVGARRWRAARRARSRSASARSAP